MPNMLDAKASISKNLADFAFKLVSMCETNCAEVISVEQCAEQMGISYQMLRRATIKMFDKTPLEILAEIRIRKMKQLLTTTNLSCRHVGIAVGLDNEVRVSRFFKMQEGISMTEYRAQFASSHQAQIDSEYSPILNPSKRFHGELIGSMPLEKSSKKLMKRQNSSLESIKNNDSQISEKETVLVLSPNFS